MPTRKISRNYPSFLIPQDQGVLDALTNALRHGVDTAETDLLESQAMMYLATATGEYLDLHGKSVGVIRFPGEDDDTYRERILFELKALHQTKQALREVILFYSPNLSDKDLEIFEPHTQLNALSVNFRSSVDRTPDHQYWGWGTVDIRSKKSLTDLARLKVEQFKAYGIRLWYTIVIQDVNTSYHDQYSLYSHTSTMTFDLPFLYPLMTASVTGALSVFSIYSRDHVNEVSINIEATNWKLPVGTVIQGYGRDAYGESPYGSPLQNTSLFEMTIEEV